MPSAQELIAHGQDVETICKMIGADGLIYQSLEDLIAAVREENPSIKRFETSVFDGVYVTNDITQEYLNKLDAARSDNAKNGKTALMAGNLETYNEGS